MLPSGHEIRLITEGETDILQRLSTLQAEAGISVWSLEDLKIFLKSGFVYAVFKKDRPCAFLQGRDTGEEIEILSIVTDPSDRSRGFATSLLNALPPKPQFLETASDNISAQKCFESAGFVKMGFRKNYYPRPDGGRVDALTYGRDA